MYTHTDIRLHRIKKPKETHMHMRAHKKIENFVFFFKKGQLV